MPEQKEINAAIKESLDLYFKDDDPQRYSQPITTAEDLVGKGLLLEDGTATSKGLLFTTLQDAGAINADGTLNDKGRSYSMPYNDSERGVLHESNREAYKMRFNDEVDRPSSTWGESLGAVGEVAWDMGAGILKSTYYNLKPWGVEEDRPRQAILGAAFIDNSIKANKELEKMLDMGAAWVRDNQFFDGSPEHEKKMEDELWTARQNQDRLRYQHQMMKTGQMMENVLELDGIVSAVEEAKKAIPREEGIQLDKQGGAAGQLATADMAVPGFFAVKGATAAPVATRAILRAQQMLGRTAAMDMKIAGMQTVLAAGETLLKKESVAGPRWAQLATNLTVRGALDDAAKAAGNASRLADDAAGVRTTLPALTVELEKAMAQRASLATRIPEAVAQKAVQTMELGRAARALPANVMGATLERVGNGLTRTDTAITGFLKERGLDQLYTGAVGAAGMLGLAGNPVLGAVGVTAGVLKTGKMLEQAGKMFRYVGKEMAQARGQIPFWQRVAAHTAPGTANRALAHTFGMFELGGATSDILRRTGRGVLAAAPVDLAFEWLSDGADMRKQTVYQAFAESMVLGGSFAAAGGITMGTKARMRELGLNDEINFRQGLVDQKQKALFEAIPTESRRAVATYSIANPTLNFNFTNKDASHYDPPTNTATINVASSNPLKPLLGHEVLHHTIIKNGMESGIAALFLGDTETNTTGGLLRAKDGSLDPNFAEFVETYNRRMDNAGAPRPKLKDLAVEYFIEQHADHYSDMAESGALGATASRGAARRWMGGVMDTLLPRGAVLKDLHFKMGGAVDANGAMVMGNGLLADGIRQTPAAQKMFRDMNRRSAGRAPGQFEPLGTDSKDAGPTVQLDPENGIDIALMHPLVVVDENGVPVMQNGKPVFIDKATDMLRGAAGVTVMEKLRENQAAGKRYAPGEMHLDDNGEVQGRWLSPEVLRDVISKNKFNSEQAQVMRSVNAAIKTGDGSRMVVINFPATKKLKNGKVVYATQAATIRDIVPVGLSITKDGNLLIGLMSVTKLHENITKRAGSKRGKRLYGGNTDQILTDVRAMMDYHKQGVDSLEFFAKKYGAVEANERKLFINTMFGLLNKKEQSVLNPLLLEDSVTSADNVYRTYRVDRVSKAVPMSPDQNPPMPFNYESTSAVKMPEMLDGGGKTGGMAPLEMPANASGASVKTKLKHSKSPTSFEATNATVHSPGIRYLPEPVYHGTPHKVDKFSLDKIGTGEGAQAYGWGLYFADDRGVAESYRAQLKPARPDGHDTAYAAAAKSFIKSNGKVSLDDMRSAYPEADAQALEYGMREARGHENGIVYTVTLDVKDEDLLDYDGEMTEEQAAKIAPLFQGNGTSRKVAFAYKELASGAGETYGGGTPELASRLLASVGIPGIRYLDGNSRSDGQGSYNYVIFDESKIKITHENDKPVTPADIRYMPEPSDLNPVATSSEAKRLYSEGKKLYAFNEQTGEPAEVTSMEMLNSYSADMLGWVDEDEKRSMPEAVLHTELEAKHNAGTITPEETAEAKKLVDEVARKSMPDSVVRPNAAPESWNPYQHDANLPLIKLFHGGEKGITDFSKNTERPDSAYNQGTLHSQGIWLTRSRGVMGEESSMFQSSDASTYADNFGEDGYVYDFYANIKNPKRSDQYQASRLTIEQLKKEGYDGVYLVDSGFWIAFDSNQLKSADPFTGVPLDQRFDSKSSDIRYMPEGVDANGEPKDMRNTSRPTDQMMPERMLPKQKMSAPEIKEWAESHTSEQLRTSLRNMRLTPTKRMLEMIGEFPEYLNPVIDYIVEKRQALKEGKISPRDVAKSYWITISSIGADAIDVSTIKRKADQIGVDFDPDPMFISEGKRGQPQMRPEELAAWWLGTKNGQKALNAIENGVIDNAAWEEGMALRDAFGRQDFRTDDRKAGGLGELPASSKDFNLSKITELTAEINKTKGDPKKLAPLLMRIKGIGEGKKGFIGHMLGMGDFPTIDAVEINAWLTGEGTTTYASENAKKRVALAKTASKSQKTSGELFKRIENRISELREIAPGGSKIPKDVAPHIIHHWIWDAAKGIETTHEGVYHAMKHYLPEPLDGGGKNGGMENKLPQPKTLKDANSLAEWLRENKSLPERYDYTKKQYVWNPKLISGIPSAQKVWIQDLKGSRASDSLYFTIGIEPDAATSKKLVDQGYEDWAEEPDPDSVFTPNGALFFNVRISDHAATSSAISTPDISVIVSKNQTWGDALTEAVNLAAGWIQ